jgi:CDP-paratose 2-epimerase
MTLVLITGSAGLVGSAAVRYFTAKGWQVLGIDKDMRREYFGQHASVAPVLQELREKNKDYVHHDLDIRDTLSLEKIFAEQGARISLIVHTAAQPSHDWAAKEPLTDFQVNAQATLQLLELTRRYCPKAVFVYTSTNKVYGDTPNKLPLVEKDTRWDIDSSHPFAAAGIDESMTIDRAMHSLFGCSKLAADLYVQEYGRYFGMATGCFRCGCITGGAHQAVELHGFLAYLIYCVKHKVPYKIFGHKGKQVRDNIHADDLVCAIDEFYKAPKPGEVYNIGGGRENSCSVLEAIELAEQVAGQKLVREYIDQPRKGDHVWWITDTRKFRQHFPAWHIRYDLERLIKDIHKNSAIRSS